MSKIADEKVFEYFLDLPLKARMELINSLQPDDKCRLTRCSKQCKKEAQHSSVKFLCLLAISEDNISISAEFHDYNLNGMRKITKPMGFRLEIKKELEQKHMTYICLDWKKDDSWRIEFDKSTDLVDLAGQIFTEQLRLHQKSIKRLRIAGDKFNLDLGSAIENFENLENLVVDGSTNASKIFSKLTRPLKVLAHQEKENKCSLGDCDQLYQVKDIIASDALQLNNEQFRRLTASRVYMKIGKLTEKDIFHFIKSWQRGEVRENFELCHWNLALSNFDVWKIFNYFGVSINDDGQTRFATEITREDIPTRKAILVRDGQQAHEHLSFKIKNAI